MNTRVSVWRLLKFLYQLQLSRHLHICRFLIVYRKKEGKFRYDSTKILQPLPFPPPLPLGHKEWPVPKGGMLDRSEEKLPFHRLLINCIT